MPKKTDIQIVSEAPSCAVTYCMYDYGEDMEGLYLDCENQYYEPEERRWVDMNLIENYFHSPRRIDDIRDLNELRQNQSA